MRTIQQMNHYMRLCTEQWTKENILNKVFLNQIVNWFSYEKNKINFYFASFQVDY